MVAPKIILVDYELFEREADDEVSTLFRPRHNIGVMLVTGSREQASIIGRSPELHVPSNQVLQPKILLGIHLPALGKQIAHVHPGLLVHEQVVALHNHQWSCC